MGKRNEVPNIATCAINGKRDSEGHGEPQGEQVITSVALIVTWIHLLEACQT